MARHAGLSIDGFLDHDKVRPGLPPARIVHLAAEKMARQEAEAVQVEAETAQAAEDEPSAEAAPADDFDDGGGDFSDVPEGELSAKKVPSCTAPWHD